MKTLRAHRTTAFTLIELLVVIAIIAIVAALVAGLAGFAGEKKRFSRTQAELGKIITLIDNYKLKVGVYPPDHPGDPRLNTLLYELAGAVRVPGSDPNYVTAFGSISSNRLWATYGFTGVINAGEKTVNPDDDARVYSLLKDLHPDQFASVVPNTLSLVVPVDGPNGKPNPWKYLSGANATNNPSSYDLWVDIVVRGQTKTIGNWKN